MNRTQGIKGVAPAVVAAALAVGGIAFLGCKSSNPDTSHGGPSGPTMSGTGGGNGSMGESPTGAMHGNPADTQPAK